MAKKRASKSVNLTVEDVAFALIGGVSGIAINPLANKALASQSETVRGYAGKALPAVKVLGGGYLATQKKMDRRARFFGIGLAAEGSVELGLKFLPSQYVGISGVSNGDVFDMIGNSSVVDIPITPSASLPTASQDDFLQEQILGTDMYSEELALQESML